MLKALITGGAGAIGKIIKPAFESDVYDVVNEVWAKTEDNLWNAERLTERMRGKDLVVHLASYPRPIPGVSDIDFMRLNLGGTVHVVGCMRMAGVKKILFSSSGAAYGDKDPYLPRYVPRDEDYPRPGDEFLSIYGKTKLACEDYLLSQKDIKVYCFRLDGPIALETGAPLDRHHLFAHVSRENFIEFIQRLAEYEGPSDVFNIGDPTTNKHCPDTIAWVTKKYPGIEVRLKSPTEPMYSVKKAQRLIGYEGKSVL